MRALNFFSVIFFLLFSHVTFAQTCDSIGVEYGWGSWVARTGNPWSPPSIPSAPCFNITSGSGIDNCTPGPNVGSPTIPVVASGFGLHSIQMGDIASPTGSTREELTYSFTVTLLDTNFTFAYAIVIEDPSHGQSDQPYVSFCIKDAIGDSVPGACFTYIAAPNLPLFYTSNCNINSVSYYKPWTVVNLNLSAYLAQVLTIKIINSDCALSGHYAKSYWDFWCGTGIVGIPEEIKPLFEVMPSVSSTGIFSVNSISEIREISVFNVTGKMVFSKALQKNKNYNDIDLSGKRNGIYFLQLKTDTGVATRKIIIAR